MASRAPSEALPSWRKTGGLELGSPGRGRPPGAHGSGRAPARRRSGRPSISRGRGPPRPSPRAPRRRPRRRPGSARSRRCRRPCAAAPWWGPGALESPANASRSRRVGLETVIRGAHDTQRDYHVASTRAAERSSARAPTFSPAPVDPTPAPNPQRGRGPFQLRDRISERDGRRFRTRSRKKSAPRVDSSSFEAAGTQSRSDFPGFFARVSACGANLRRFSTGVASPR